MRDRAAAGGVIAVSKRGRQQCNACNTRAIVTGLELQHGKMARCVKAGYPDSGARAATATGSRRKAAGIRRACEEK